MTEKVIMLIQEYVKLMEIAIQTNDKELYAKVKYNTLVLLEQLSPSPKEVESEAKAKDTEAKED